MVTKCFRGTGPIAIGITAVLFATTVRAQECSFTLGEDTLLCAGQNVLLAGPSDALSIVWQNGWAVQYLTADTTGVYWCTASFPVPGEDLVVNGNFDQGTTGFTTDLQVGTGGTWGPLSLEGTYGVTTNPNLLHSNFSSCGDHTGGGSMLLANGSAVPGENVWCQTIAVQPNTTYAFSAWLMSASPTNPAVMTFSVNGVSLGGNLLARPVTCIWDEFYALWNSGSATTANICIVNQNITQSGNDFALDDIAFSPLCSYTDSISVTVLPEAPQVVVEAVGPICPGATAQLSAELVPANWPLNDLSYAWSNGASTPQTTVNAPGIYDVSVTGRCVDTQTTVEVEEDVCLTTLTMPNVFSPNGDGSNDSFGPIVDGEPLNFEMEIRNRWGQVVYRTSQVQAKWSGRAGGEVVPDGTYYWNVKYTERQANGSLVQRDLSGHLMLLGSR
ncbi:MAG: gliding motility-associated C-terminal domain-containing protein [Flavobacteriales bacterium]